MGETFRKRNERGTKPNSTNSVVLHRSPQQPTATDIAALAPTAEIKKSGLLERLQASHLPRSSRHMDGGLQQLILIHAHNRREFPPSAPPSIPTQFHLFSSENKKKRKGVVIYP